MFPAAPAAPAAVGHGFVVSTLTNVDAATMPAGGKRTAPATLFEAEPRGIFVWEALKKLKSAESAGCRHDYISCFLEQRQPFFLHVKWETWLVKYIGSNLFATTLFSGNETTSSIPIDFRDRI